jgi:hypothetical protein
MIREQLDHIGASLDKVAAHAAKATTPDMSLTIR